MSGSPGVPRALLAPLIALLVGLTLMLAYASGALDGAERAAVDLRFSVRGAEPPRDTVVVEIDDVTFGELGEQWPFPRSLHARVIDRLRRAGASVIAYDVEFTEPTEEREDLALFEAVGRAPGTVLAASEVDERGMTNVLGGEDNLAEVGARAANTGLPPDEGGAVRTVPSSLEGLSTFAAATAEASGARRPAFPRGRPAWIDFHGPPGTVPALSFSRVLRGRFPVASVRDKVVIVGATAPSLQDLHATPTSGAELMSGPELQANAISTVRGGLPLRSWPAWLDLVTILALAFAGPLVGRRLSLAATAGAMAALALLVAVGAQAAFDGGTIVSVAHMLLALTLGTVGALGANYLGERRERARTRLLFGRFVPEPVVKELLDQTDGQLRLGARRLEATVLFCDLRGFTGFAEATDVERVIETLNNYLTEMSDAILDHGGTVVAYMGDGVMAVFGSPVERPDHADAALAAAREMLELRLPRFNDWVRHHDLWTGFEMGIGVNSGPVMSGHVGSERRLEYAVIGDTTNVAARLEAMTKDSPHHLLVGEGTRALLSGDERGLVKVGRLAVSGRREPLDVCAFATEASGGASAPTGETGAPDVESAALPTPEPA